MPRQFRFNIGDLVRSHYQAPWIGIITEREARKDTTPLYTLKVVLDRTGRPIPKRVRSQATTMDEAWLDPYTPKSPDEADLIRAWAAPGANWTSLRDRVVRLAYTRPDLKRHLLPLLTERVASEDEEEEDRLGERLNEAIDIEASVARLIDTIEPLADVDDTPALHAKALATALSNASTVENEADLDANLKDASKAADDLRQALQAAKRHLKGTDDVGEDVKAAAEEAIADGLSLLRTIISDIKAI